MEKSSESPPATISFLSLPYDVVINCLARISRVHHPSLSLVSKSFRSLLSSRELYATRTLIGKSENFIYLCLELPCADPKPCWFTHAQTPEQRLLPIPSFSYKHPFNPAVVSIGSEIYVIGGFVNGHRSRKAFLLDCRSHQLRMLPNMRSPRGNPTARLIDGKIYVFGGCSTHWVVDSCGEIYDPKTEAWEPFSPADLRIQKSVSETLGKVFFQMRVSGSGGWKRLHWCDLEEISEEPAGFCIEKSESKWREVKGFEGLKNPPDVISIENPGGGTRLKVWWVTYKRDGDGCLVHKYEIWCGEISFERRNRQELFGIVECSKLLYTLDRPVSNGRLLISLFCFATVTL